MRWYNVRMKMKYLAVLGRQAEICLAELVALYSDVVRIGAQVAVVNTDRKVDIDRLGGVMKIGPVLEDPPVEFLRAQTAGKITLGVSDYRQKAEKDLGLKLKRQVGRSMRVVPSENGVVSTAAAYHNQLGEKQNHIELAYFDGGVANVRPQNITAYARRDQARPARDAKVGMLPPKLAQILINLCGDLPEGAMVLDPFCGTGVVLQEAVLMGYRAYGTDLSDKMVGYAKRNMEWLKKDAKMEVGDATNYTWKQPVDAVASEVYLGAPMSQPPAEIKLRQQKEETGGILMGFLKNLAEQVGAGTPVVLAIPAWLRPDESYARLNLLDDIEKLGYNVVKFDNLGDLLYHREGQIVAREIIVLRKI